MISWLHIVLVYLSSWLLAALSTPFVIMLAQKYGLVDDPEKRKHPAHVHTGVIPRAGGLAIYIPILVCSLIFVPMSQILFGILLGAGLIVIMGLLDDKYDLSPRIRLFMNFLIVGIVILFGLGIPYISNPFGGVIQLDHFKFTYELFGQTKNFLVLSNIFALLWIVAMMNFVNWSSGVDGQLAGFSGISCLFLGLLALRFSAHEISSISVALLAFISAGAFLGYFPWNFYPQKIMPGYSGGALAGFMLGVLSILSWGKIGTMALLLSVPIVDGIYSIMRRIMNKKSPLRGDADHFHHRLLAIGWGKRRIAVFYLGVSFLFGVSALLFESHEKLLAITIVMVLLALFIGITNRIKSQGQG